VLDGKAQIKTSEVLKPISRGKKLQKMKKRKPEIKSALSQQKNIKNCVMKAQQLLCLGVKCKLQHISDSCLLWVAFRVKFGVPRSPESDSKLKSKYSYH